jgi:hypothetical protein
MFTLCEVVYYVMLSFFQCIQQQKNLSGVPDLQKRSSVTIVKKLLYLSRIVLCNKSTILQVVLVYDHFVKLNTKLTVLTDLVIFVSFAGTEFPLSQSNQNIILHS